METELALKYAIELEKKKIKDEEEARDKLNKDAEVARKLSIEVEKKKLILLSKKNKNDSKINNDRDQMEIPKSETCEHKSEVQGCAHESVETDPRVMLRGGQHDRQ